MSQLITTISVLGDDAVMNSLIDGSLTEFIDDIATDIGQYAFSDRFDNLNIIHLQNVTTIQPYSFKNCKAKEVILPSIQYIDKSSNYFGSSKVEKYDFTDLKEISTGSSTSSQRPFYGCNDIKAFIIRNPEMCTISGSYSPFENSSIGTIGYIYVPKNLVESYKTASVWSTYVDYIRAIEDYPEICDLYSWAAVAKTIENGTYKDVYKIGDCVPLDLGSEGVVNMQIAAFDADDLADGSGKAHISWVAKELLATEKRFNPELVTNDDGTYQEGTGTIGGWEKSELRVYIKNSIKPLIPESVRSQIVEVLKYSNVNNTDTVNSQKENNGTIEDVWIPSVREMFGANGYLAEKSGAEYSMLFKDNKSRKKNDSYWLRSCATRTHGRSISESGTGSNVQAERTYKIAIGFCT